VRRLSITWCAFVGVIAIAGAASGQGLTPLTEQRLSELQAGKSNCGEVEPPLLEAFWSAQQARMKVITAAGDRGQSIPAPDDAYTSVRLAYRASPYFFILSTPCSRAAHALSEAERRFEQPALPSLAELNGGEVILHVRPAWINPEPEQTQWENLVAAATGEQPLFNPFTNARTLENVVLKRGDMVIRPVKANVRPLTITNPGGATRVVSEGDFSFTLMAFSPGEPVTIIFIAKEGNFEFTMPASVLQSLK
jgi:hypothetical protein